MPKTIIVTFECIVREPEGEGFKLHWLGHPENPLAMAVARCNDGTATNDDFAALEAVPVFDKDNECEEIEIVEKIGRIA